MRPRAVRCVLAVLGLAWAGACGGDRSYVGVRDPGCGADCPAVLAAGQDDPIAIAADGGDVFWVNHGSGIGTGAVMAMPGGLGTPVVLVAGLTRPVALAVAGADVFWSESGLDATGGRIARVPRAGGAVVPLASGLVVPSWLAVKDGVVYWREEGSGRLASLPAAGGAVTALAAGDPGVGAAALGPEGLYWMATGDAFRGGDVRVIALAGGEPQARGGGFQSATALAADEGGVYMAWDMGGGSIGRVWPLAAGADQPEMLAYDQPLPRALTASGGRLFWSDHGAGPGDGSTMMLPDGQVHDPIAPPVTIAWRQPEPGALAVSGDRVYWVNRGTPATGSIMTARWAGR